MPSTDPRLDPSTPSNNYLAMLPSWKKIDTLLAGTESMRSAGESMMPRHSNETDEAYSERNQRATLLNIADLTLNTWTGKPFGEPVTVGEDVPEQIAEWLEDADLQGNDLSVFARDWFRAGMAGALAHVLVDAPSAPLPGEQSRTLADDAREGRRPFMNFIRPENLFAAASTIVDGQEVLTHARIFEREVVREGFAERSVDRIREFNRVLPGETVLALMGTEGIREGLADGRISPEEFEAIDQPGVFVTLWEKIEKNNDEEEWVVVQPPTRLDERMDEIPIVTFYADRQGLHLGKPPIEDLADLNINWWQSNSDQNMILTVTRFPMLALSGGDEDEVETEVGPRRMLFTPDPQGKFYYVEHTGSAIEAGRQDLKDLEERMGHYGADFMKKRPTTTATEKVIDNAETTSPLQDASMRFNESLQKAVGLMGKWVGVDEVGTVSVRTEFDDVQADAGDLDFLDKARNRGDLSKKEFFEEAKLRGALRPEFDMEENEQALQDERAEAGFDGETTDGDDIDPLAEE